MALTLESLVAVKQQAYSFSFLTAGQKMQLKALFMYFAQHRRVTTISSSALDIVAFANLTTYVAPADAAATLYAAFVKKQNTSTAATFKINDSATAAGGASGANMTDAIELTAANKDALLIWPDGKAHGTGIAVASETNGAGGTNSTSGDGPNGFVIFGAA